MGVKFLLAAALILFPAAAQAQVNQATAKAEFDVAVRFFDAEEYEAALPHFEKAYQASGKRPATIFALAQCERALKMYAKAKAHFEEYLATHPSEDDAVAVRETLKLLQELEAGVKKNAQPPEPESKFGTIAVSSKPSGGQITIDAAPTGLLTPAELKTVPLGDHRILVETEEAIGEARVAVRAAKTSTVEVALRERPCLLDISTVPTGAQITVDGLSIGESPLTVEVKPGPLEITARTHDGRIGKASVIARPSRAPKAISLMLAEEHPPPSPVTVAPALVKPEPQPEKSGVSWGWIVAGGVLIGGGAVLDLGPQSAHNGKIDGTDFIPLALYGAGAIAALIGIL